MFSPRLRFAIPIVVACVVCLLLDSPRLTASGDEPRIIRPTVTVGTGDTGSTFFGTAPDPLKTRRYYIAAEIVPWDFAPSGRDDMCGFTLPPAVVANRTRIKLRYFQYTDATFTVRALNNPALGVLGPMLRGVVGEYLAVTLLNRTHQPVSLHPHGVRYDKDSEGAYYRPSPGRGAAVGPGAKFTYVWQLDEASGPLPTEPSSKGWLYRCHVAEHMHEGMFAQLTVFAPDQIGISRDPTVALLGLPAAPRSLRLDRTEAILNFVAPPARAGVVIVGTLSAPEDFLVHRQTVRVRLGDREIVVELNAAGIGKAPHAWFRINNTEDTSRARGGRLDFELFFNGADWLGRPAPGAPAHRPLPLVIEIGSARLTAAVHFNPPAHPDACTGA
jgi:hypothetical protein